MKLSQIILTLVLLLSTKLFAQVEEVSITKSQDSQSLDSSDIFYIVEEMPIFQYKDSISTEADFQDYIEDNIKIPSNKCKGKAYIQFIVETDGSLNDTNILLGPKKCDGYHDEINRLISSMPKWKPGKHNGKTVRVIKTFEIDFSNN
jgi:periplasmic protein TonB